MIATKQSQKKLFRWCPLNIQASLLLQEKFTFPLKNEIIKPDVIKDYNGTLPLCWHFEQGCESLFCSKERLEIVPQNCWTFYWYQHLQFIHRLEKNEWFQRFTFGLSSKPYQNNSDVSSKPTGPKSAWPWRTNEQYHIKSSPSYRASFSFPKKPKSWP